MTLSDYCALFRICPIKAMNLLQDWGCVADECVTTDDVAPCDQKTSIGLVRLNKEDLKVSER
jgi:hypothetical protein